MAKQKTTLEKIHALRKEIGKLEDKIKQLQAACQHAIKCERNAVGFNGYSTDYTTYCVCQLCQRSWFHDGYCSGDHKGL